MTLFRIALVACALAAVVPPSAVVNAQAAPPWSIVTSYAVKETADGNVLLQDLGSRGRQHSMVTSITPGIGLNYLRSSAFKAAFTYTPEVVRFHSVRSENHVAHRTALNFSGRVNRTAWEFTNALVVIDGSRDGPLYEVISLCDIPALGGIPVRDRRDAVVLRNGIRLTHDLRDWFLRPQFTSYVHNFRTTQRPRTGAWAGYENYVDRYELSGGLDAGRRVGENTWLVLGHRYGHQEQGKLLGVDSPYSNSYNRVLVGLEGSPAPWLRLNLLGGPDLRRFNRRPAGFDPDELLWFINSTVSWIPGKRDTLTATFSRFQQPAFSSQSVYEDIVYEVSWRHQYTKRLSGAAGFRAYGGDWQAPVAREDWIYTPSATLTYSLHKHFTAELAYSYDTVSSAVPNTRGREFIRPMFSITARGSF